MLTAFFINRFGSNFPLFVFLSIFCSGTFPVLKLVSSNIFGLSIFESGLLSAELRELSKIKIRCTIMLENVPQIIVQGIWIYINGLQDETLLALTASSLSIVATLLIFWGERQLDAHYVVSTYFIALRTHGIILKDERAAMDNKKKLRNALKKKLAAVLGSRDKEIQIGCVTQRDCGLVIHVQQLVFSKQLDLYRVILLS